MKYSVHDYAKALVASCADPKISHAVIEKNFLELIRRNGDEARAKKILDEAARLMRSKTGMKGVSRDVMIESARPLAKAQEATIKKILKPGDTVTYGTDPDLIAGVKITVNDEMQFDGTMKTKLDKLFAV